MIPGAVGRHAPRDALDPQDLLAHVRAVWLRAAPPTDPQPHGVDLVDEGLQVTLHWRSPQLLGVHIPRPTDTHHPAWSVWDPSTTEEWAEWAVRQTLVEQVLTGLTSRTAPVIVDGVARYPLDVPGWASSPLPDRPPPRRPVSVPVVVRRQRIAATEEGRCSRALGFVGCRRPGSSGMQKS